MLNISINSIQNDRVYFTTEKSEDAYAFAGKLLTYKTFKYSSDEHVLSISISEWPKFYAEMMKNKGDYNIRFGSPKLFKTLSSIEEVPLYHLSKHERFILIKCEKGSNPNLFVFTKSTELELQLNRYQFETHINGAIRKDYQTHSVVEFPLTEAYRLIPIITEIQQNGIPIKVEASVSAFASKQAQDRESLDKLALASDVDYPDVLKTITLRPFQKVGAKFVEATGGRAIICDEMGLGKSAQALAYVQNNNLNAVIVCPAALRSNWARYVRDYLNENPYVCSGEMPGAYDIEVLMTKKHRIIIINYDILGSSEEMKKAEHGKPAEYIYPWALFINAAGYDCIIFDEFHKIKNTEAKRTKAALTLSAKKIIGLSGTPLLNRPEEAWPMLHLLDRETFPSFGRFVSQYSAGRYGVKNLTQLQNLLKTRMIRRIKKDVVKELPPINRVNEIHEFSKAAKVRYDKVLSGIYETLSGGRYDVQNILVQIMRLKQVCAQDKMETTCELAESLNESMEGEYKKVIIFTQFKECVTYIKNTLGMPCVSITGEDDDSTRMNAVDAFQNSADIQFMVCTTQVASEGLNLTKAGAVIFNDLMWTPAAHQQAEGRAYGRLNDSHSISSYYVLVENSVETYIQSLLAGKLATIESIVDGTNSVRAGESVASELIDYLKNGG